jgi:23S rRNA (cytidine1920-2'-O)/16S rRNA (cytidine1409-2'-O)-methyltransferase
VTNRKLRLDLALVERGLCISRESAQALIFAGDVRVDGHVVSRPSALVLSSAQLVVVAPPPYVSRGGFKLARALHRFQLSVENLTLVDVGASTGGFTDVLLQRGAGRVYAVDVGHGQLAWKIRRDPRVVVIERANIRYLERLPELVDAAVIDVSFISLTLVLPPVQHLVKPHGWIVALIKPQFEAGRSQVGKGGVVRDASVHREVLERVLTWALGNGLVLAGCIESPITGPAGNREFLALFQPSTPGVPIADAISSCLGETAALASGI